MLTYDSGALDVSTPFEFFLKNPNPVTYTVASRDPWTHGYPLTCQSSYEIIDGAGNVLYPHPTDADYIFELDFTNHAWG